MNLTSLVKSPTCVKITFLVLGAFISTVSFASQDINFDSQHAVYLLTDKQAGIEQVKDLQFQKLEYYPDILKRPQEKTTWIKTRLLTSERKELVFDFVRKDYVQLHILIDDSLVASYQTGFLLPANEKKMGRWNAIDYIFEPDTDYTIFVQIDNEINDPDLIILVEERGEWRDTLLYNMIKDIAFLSAILIISLYTMLLFFQNKMKVFFHFSMYLLSVFVFYLYILDILRDFFIADDPHLTQYSLIAALLGPVFYISFTREFLNMKQIMPKWDKMYSILTKVNLLVVVVSTMYFILTKDYYFFVDITRFSLFVNVGCGLCMIPVFLKQKNTLVYYYLIGSCFMLGALVIDIFLWTSSESLGAYAQIGYVLEIVLFSLGLGKKLAFMDKEREKVQKSYIEQMEINEQLIVRQKQELEDTVTERTKELQISKEEAERNARAKEEFLSVMSHEIRTPMNAIVGLTHMLPADGKDQAFTENITTLRYSVDNLMLLINNVLDYNKISAGKVQLEQIDFDLHRIVYSVCHLFKSKADSKGLDFIIHLDENVPQLINGDPFRLSQILNNFLSNAIKFTEKGSIGLRVSLRAENESSVNLRFEVTDTGVGVPLQKQAIIFDSFTQVSADVTRRFGGTGLGLAISSDLVHLMDGSVEMKSEEGSGSRFLINLTFTKTNNLNGSSHDFGNYSKFKNAELSDLSVLIVDDNELNRMVLKKFTDKWLVNSDSAENGLAALQKLREKKFDIVLLDLQMPEMDGYETARAMSDNPDMQTTPIIAISADTISNVYENVIESGMDDFITKPFNPDELKSKIYLHVSKVRE